jgi:hypothetical protein
LLQESYAKENNYELAELDLKRIQREPVERISRRSEMIIGMSSPGLLIKGGDANSRG